MSFIMVQGSLRARLRGDNPEEEAVVVGEEEVVVEEEEEVLVEEMRWRRRGVGEMRSIK